MSGWLAKNGRQYDDLTLIRDAEIAHLYSTETKAHRFADWRQQAL